MATYAELLTAFESDSVRNRVRVALIVACEAIRTEPSNTPNKTNRMRWAKATLASPASVVDSMMWAVLAQNRAQPLSTILGASDAAVQAAVDAAIDVLAQG